MALRNAFDLLGTENTLRRILSAVTWARTPSDQMRVVVDSGAITASLNAANTSAAVGVTAVAPYASTSWNIHDIREQYMYQSQQNWNQMTSRWTY